MTVAEQGQITRAAAKLHIAQPALSQTIAKLEAAVGVRLLERHPRGVSLTPAGEAFLEKARIAVRAAEEAASVVGPWARAEGTLLLGFTPCFNPVARPLMAHFAQAHPDVQLQASTLSPGRSLLDLRAGVIDAELLLPPDGREPDLIVQELFHARHFVLVGEGHHLAGERSLVFDQIADETFPGLHASVPRQWAAAAWLTDRRGQDPAVTAETPLTLDEVWALVRTGRAISVLPEFMVPPTIGNGVRAMPLTDVEPVVIALAWRANDDRLALTALAQSALSSVLQPASESAARGESGDFRAELTVRA